MALKVIDKSSAKQVRLHQGKCKLHMHAYTLVAEPFGFPRDTKVTKKSLKGGQNSIVNMEAI